MHRKLHRAASALVLDRVEGGRATDVRAERERTSSRNTWEALLQPWRIAVMLVVGLSIGEMLAIFFFGPLEVRETSRGPKKINH